MSIISSISSVAKDAGTLVEMYISMIPNASVESTVSFVQKNADLLIAKFVNNTVLDGIADMIVNQIIDEEVPALYAKEMQKLGGIPVPAPTLAPTPETEAPSTTEPSGIEGVNVPNPQ